MGLTKMSTILTLVLDRFNYFTLKKSNETSIFLARITGTNTFSDKSFLTLEKIGSYLRIHRLIKENMRTSFCLKFSGCADPPRALRIMFGPITSRKIGYARVVELRSVSGRPACCFMQPASHVSKCTRCDPKLGKYMFTLSAKCLKTGVILIKI